MARFSICGGDDGEGSSSHGSRKRQRLPSIEEDEEESDAGSSGEENDEETREEDNNCRGGRRMVSDDGGSTSDDSDHEVVIEERQFVNSVNSESSSSNKDSSLSVTLLDSDVLDCPICCEPLKTPIFQCDNGHLACSVCCTKVRNRCPCCTLPIGYIRCRAMEKVIETSRVSCTNAKYGCKQNMLYGNRFQHEKLCVFTPCSCPIHNCNYTGYYKDVNNHVRLKHKDDVIPFVWDTSVRISLDIDQKTTVLQEEKSGEVIVVQLFQGLHGVYVTVSCIRPLSPVVGTLSCYLVNVTVDSSLKQVFKVKNIQKVGNEHPKDGFMVIPSYMLSATLLDPEALYCPVCCEALTIPIFQCTNGHIVCSNKLRNKCPSCALPIGQIRCRAMERVIEAVIVPCPNAELGCTKSVSYGKEGNVLSLYMLLPRAELQLHWLL